MGPSGRPTTHAELEAGIVRETEGYRADVGAGSGDEGNLVGELARISSPYELEPGRRCRRGCDGRSGEAARRPGT